MSAAADLPTREREALAPVRALANQAFSRAAGAPLIPGNRIRLLKDAGENYPAWLEAIRAAKRPYLLLTERWARARLWRSALLSLSKRRWARRGSLITVLRVSSCKRPISSNEK